VAVPTLVAIGDADTGGSNHVAQAQVMAERIPGAELVVFDQASHLSVAEQPAAFTATLDGFLKRVPA
jgi:3-oxoadipate enol-lactonase